MTRECDYDDTALQHFFETCFLAYYAIRFYKCFMRTWEECEWVQDPLYVASKSSLLIVFKSSVYLLTVLFCWHVNYQDLLTFPTTMVGLSIFSCSSINFYFICFKAILLNAYIFNIIFYWEQNSFISWELFSLTSNYIIPCLLASVGVLKSLLSVE